MSQTDIKTSRVEVNVRWEGPHRFADIPRGGLLDNADVDYGVYQVYGHHALYGDDVLLYIGKADKRPFATRLLEEEWAVHLTLTA